MCVLFFIKASIRFSVAQPTSVSSPVKTAISAPVIPEGIREECWVGHGEIIIRYLINASSVGETSAVGGERFKVATLNEITLLMTSISESLSTKTGVC
ncbi:hypothetical protein PtA15_4A851 [Puccinia triticina]|uniref:Uncharacterized protein n=1 Tax=Puccinia triticina TaxID=208348 RepID=A0ABY7CGR6_9BASI|nr:uncharacterized protein PtA15_4A851 [Puccinia triticina]WAQ84398.1 hypothetical protein PtA15_4A851 [Puccinia triticina]